MTAVITFILGSLMFFGGLIYLSVPVAVIVFGFVLMILASRIPDETEES